MLHSIWKMDPGLFLRLFHKMTHYLLVPLGGLNKMLMIPLYKNTQRILRFSSYPKSNMVGTTSMKYLGFFDNTCCPLLLILSDLCGKMSLSRLRHCHSSTGDHDCPRHQLTKNGQRPFFKYGSRSTTGPGQTWDFHSFLFIRIIKFWHW